MDGDEVGVNRGAPRASSVHGWRRGDSGCRRAQGVAVTAASAREEAARALWNEHYAPLAGWCAAQVGDRDAAHEIAAEAFTRLLSKWITVRDPKGYLYVTAIQPGAGPLAPGTARPQAAGPARGDDPRVHPGVRPLDARPGRAAARAAAHTRPAPLLRRHERGRGGRRPAQARRNSQANVARRPDPPPRMARGGAGDPDAGDATTTARAAAAATGAFDTVLRRARARRYRRLSTVAASTGVFLAGLWGGLAMAGGVAGVQDTSSASRTNASDLVKADPPTESPTKSSAKVVPPSGGHSSSAPVGPTGSPTDTGHARVAMVRGLVVDSRGAPVVGMFVYTGTLSGSSFIPGPPRRPSRTTRAGTRCRAPTNPVLLTPWTLNESRGAATGRWAATYVTSPKCSTAVASTVTEVLPSASVQGHVKTDKGCADSDFSLWLWLNGNRPTAVRLGNLNEGDTFTISGLPEGTHVLGGRGRHIQRDGEGRRARDPDVTFACPDEPTGTPTVTPSELPTPTDTTTPDPSESPTPTGTAGAGWRLSRRSARRPAGRPRRTGRSGRRRRRPASSSRPARRPGAQVADPLPQRGDRDRLDLVGRAVQPPLVQRRRSPPASHGACPAPRRPRRSPSPRDATVLTIGGRQSPGARRSPRASMCRSSRTVASAPSRSALLTT